MKIRGAEDAERILSNMQVEKVLKICKKCHGYKSLQQRLRALRVKGLRRSYFMNHLNN